MLALVPVPTPVAGRIAIAAAVGSLTAHTVFLATTGGASAAEARAIARYLGTKGAEVVGAAASQGRPA
ncbi:hypothetical protein [Streptomyces abikoensis]|uniref:hypothetical protein n=1 Tax=Streptomyces abikoensis TaxID=97398 RepID=UPI003403E64C